MMNDNSNADDRRIHLQNVLSGFSNVDAIVFVFIFIGVFDDVRGKIKSLIGSKSESHLYHPIFLFKSVVVPSFSIGNTLAKKRLSLMQLWEATKQKEQEEQRWANR